MSFEGYYQVICMNGHYYNVPVNYSWDEDKTCDDCKAEAAWSSLVDDTNCDAYGLMPDFELAKLKVADAVVYQCQDPKCGHSKLVEPTRYRVPTEDEGKLITNYSAEFVGTDDGAGKHVYRNHQSKARFNRDGLKYDDGGRS